VHASSVEACVNSVDARRARIALLGADGMSERAIAERVGIAERHVPRIRARFIAGGAGGGAFGRWSIASASKR